jgi:hypothetical protein
MNQSLTYALGYSESELKRLESQGAFFRDLTEDLLRRSGVVSGMRVLDIGCGVGDVSLLAGELVRALWRGTWRRPFERRRRCGTSAGSHGRTTLGALFLNRT